MPRRKPPPGFPREVFHAARAGEVAKENAGVFAQKMVRLPRTLQDLRAIPALAWVSPGPKLSETPAES